MMFYTSFSARPSTRVGSAPPPTRWRDLVGNFSIDRRGAAQQLALALALMHALMLGLALVVASREGIGTLKQRATDLVIVQFAEQLLSLAQMLQDDPP